MRIPLIAGNWKMHKTPSEALTWLGTFLTALDQEPLPSAHVVLNVPATHIAGLAARSRGGPVAIGAQDLSAHDEGPYTGEVSGAMLSDAGAGYVIVGHSERRALHHEDDALVAAKLAAAGRHGLVPILCIGEGEADRDAGRHHEVVLGQLRAALGGFDVASADSLVIAYEPVWAIGTGRTATAADAQDMCARIRDTLRDERPVLADGIRILYGGSMKPGNAVELLDRPDIDGGLIGGASLVADEFLAIVRASR